MEPTRCKKIKNSGERCGGYAMEGSAYCYAHSPETRDDWHAAQKRGGRSGGRKRSYKSIARAMGVDVQDIDLSTEDGYIEALTLLVRAGMAEMDLTSSNFKALISGFKAVAEARYLPELSETIEELEARING